MKNFLTFLVLLAIPRLLADKICTEITSQNIEVHLDGDDCRIIFSDDVTVNSDDFNLKSEQVEIIAENISKSDSSDTSSRVKTIIAQKHARFVQKYRCGEADKIIVHVKQERMEMFGNAKISDKSGTITGDYLTIDNETRVLVMNAGKTSDKNTRSKIILPSNSMSKKQNREEDSKDPLDFKEDSEDNENKETK